MALLILGHHALEAVLAIDMETLEQSGIFEGIKADGAGELVFQLLEGYSLTFASHMEQPEKLEPERAVCIFPVLILTV